MWVAGQRDWSWGLRDQTSQGYESQMGMTSQDHGEGSVGRGLYAQAALGRVWTPSSVCPLPGGRRDQRPPDLGQEDHTGVQWKRGHGSCQGDWGSAGHPEPPARKRGETHRRQHCPGEAQAGGGAAGCSRPVGVTGLTASGVSTRAFVLSQASFRAGNLQRKKPTSWASWPMLSIPAREADAGESL